MKSNIPNEQSQYVFGSSKACVVLREKLIEYDKNNNTKLFSIFSSHYTNYCHKLNYLKNNVKDNSLLIYFAEYPKLEIENWIKKQYGVYDTDMVSFALNVVNYKWKNIFNDFFQSQYVNNVMSKINEKMNFWVYSYKDLYYGRIDQNIKEELKIDVVEKIRTDVLFYPKLNLYLYFSIYTNRMWVKPVKLVKTIHGLKYRFKFINNLNYFDEWTLKNTR